MTDRPDWLIVGQRHPDGGVVVFASRSMTGHANIREVGSTMRGNSVTFTVQMRDYLSIRADTYIHALADLFSQWDPGTGDPAAALEGRGDALHGL